MKPLIIRFSKKIPLKSASRTKSKEPPNGIATSRLFQKESLILLPSFPFPPLSLYIPPGGNLPEKVRQTFHRVETFPKKSGKLSTGWKPSVRRSSASRKAEKQEPYQMYVGYRRALNVSKSHSRSKNRPLPPTRE
jgi:hypothetical protein